MSSLNQLVSEIAHSVGQPNNYPLKQNIKELEQHLKNNDLTHEQAKELISKYFVNVW